MRRKLVGGRLIDPANGIDEIGDLTIEGGKIVADDGPADEEFDARGCIVMAGAIDVHSHIAGPNVTLARHLMPELARAEGRTAIGAAFDAGNFTASEIGRAYARMGYTTVVEPAIAPMAALAAHLELSEIPIIDRAGLCVLGNDDYLLSLLRSGESRAAIRDFIAASLAASGGLGVKVVNAGGAAAFKEGAAAFGLDDAPASYGITSRAILNALLDGVEDLGLPHPLHCHASNLGAPNAAASLIATMRAAEGRRLHLAHAQFYAYRPAEGGFASAAQEICAEMARHPNVTLDVGQVAFGQTVTISLDILRQFAGRANANPRKWALVAGDAEGGGVVPHAYKRRNNVGALQFAIGLELLLSAPDPWRALLSTDHPNGGPFTAYPWLLHLLMDKDMRDRELASLHPWARERSGLGAIAREMTLSEVAILTRAAPARLLGLSDRGHLGVGARADVAVYRDRPDRTAMFSRASLAFKDGRLIARDGEIVLNRPGRTLRLSIDGDPGMAGPLDRYLSARYGQGLADFAVTDAAFAGRGVDGCEHFASAPWPR